MDRTTVGERAFAAPPVAAEALEFVRFCHRRRRVGWPELYDEMCAVAGRGLYRGYGTDELASIGIGFGLFQMPGLASVVAQVVAEDVERRQRTAEAVRASVVMEAQRSAPASTGLTSDGDTDADPMTHRGADSGPADRRAEPAPIEVADLGAIRIAVAAGA